MTLSERLRQRFQHRLQEGDDALGGWGWTAIIIASLSILTILIGIALSFDHFDNIATAFVGLGAGLLLLSLISPGWAGTVAVRRHRRRLATRRAAFQSRRELADSLYATDRIDEATFRRQRGLLDAYLDGVGPGDASRVAATWSRLVGIMFLTLGIGALGLAAYITTWDAPDIEAVATPVASTMGIITGAIGATMLVLAVALGRDADGEAVGHRQRIEEAHEEMLIKARNA